MNRSEYRSSLEQLRVAAERGQPSIDGTDVLMQDLLKTKASWTHDAMLDLVYGAHGNKLASLSIICLVHGCKPRAKAPNNGHRARGFGDAEQLVFAAEPFAKHCLERGREELLKVIATRGIPVHLMAYKSEKVDNVLKRVNWTPRAASTAAGDALDVMSATEGTTRESFADLLLELQSYRPTKPDVLVAGAKLLAELDPDHPDVHKMAGTPVGALFTEQLMRRRIAAAAVQAPACPTDFTAASRRNLRSI